MITPVYGTPKKGRYYGKAAFLASRSVAVFPFAEFLKALRSAVRTTERGVALFGADAHSDDSLNFWHRAVRDHGRVQR